MEPCFVCLKAPRTCGVLCGACAADLAGDDLCPEQMSGRLQSPLRGARNAWLIDGFGMPHSVAVQGPVTTAVIGRGRRNDVCVAEVTVSLSHASLEHRARSNAWFISDLDSENGTRVNDTVIERRYPLESGDRIFIGRRVGFVFIGLEDDDVARAEQALFALKANQPSVSTRADAGVDNGVVLKIAAVTEGGAVATWGDERVQLSELEYELLSVLHGRYTAEGAHDAAVRGYVPAPHLLEVLSFKSEAPTHANLRGLVRNVRQKLSAGDPSLDVIESKKGLGYRLARPLTLA